MTQLRKTGGYDYKVTRNGSILDPKRRIIPPGTMIEPGMFTKEQIAEHLRSGWLVRVNRPHPEAEDEIPGVGEPRPLPHGLDEKDREKMVTEVLSEPGDVVKVTKTSPPPAVPKGTWTFDPAVLADKSVEQLNTMILERDESVEPFDTIEEAVAFLSQEFEEEV